MDSTVMALKQHLANTGSKAKIAVNLEWRVGIQQVGIGAPLGIIPHLAVVGKQMEHVPDDAVGMVAIQQPGPEIDFPPKAPAGGHVATLPQRRGGCLEQFGMTVGRNLIGGIQTVKVGHVPMLVGRVVSVNEPLLQLPVAAHLHGSQTRDGRFELLCLRPFFAQEDGGVECL